MKDTRKEATAAKAQPASAQPAKARLDAAEKQRQENPNNVPLVFGCLMLGMLMSSLGQMIFSTALPTLVGELGGADKMSWVITSFLLTMTIGMPVYGKLGDQMLSLIHI